MKIKATLKIQLELCDQNRAFDEIIESVYNAIRECDGVDGLIRLDEYFNKKNIKMKKQNGTSQEIFCPICKSDNIKKMLDDGFRCLKCNTQGHLRDFKNCDKNV